MKREENKQAAREFVENGGKCISRYGWAYRGARASVISKEEALKKLNEEGGWNFGIGFWELSWRTIDGEDVLEFNELSENDMW